MKDYYETLGVNRDADAGALKSAYRKLAMKYHPDRNPGDAEAESRFKEANEAYEILKDSDKRAAYDRSGHEAFAIRASLEEEIGSLAQFLRPVLRRVLVIGVLLAVLQQVTGINVFLYYAPEILKSVAGAETDVALLQTVLVGAVNLGFTVLAIWTVDRLGRRPLMIVGAAGMGLCLTAIGLAASAQAIGGWLLVFMLGYIACFAMSVGPVTWVILSEIFPTRIRGRAMAIAAFCLWVANFAVSQTFPMMDGNPWLVERFHHGFPFWIYAGFCLVLVVVMIRLVPETKGRSLEELESLWAQEKHALPNSGMTVPVMNQGSAPTSDRQTADPMAPPPPIHDRDGHATDPQPQDAGIEHGR